MKKMNVLILAAGRGSRLGKISQNKPKILLNFKGKTIFDHQLEVYKKIKNIKLYVVGGYKINKLKKYILKKDIKLINNEKFKYTNMYYSFLLAEKLMKKKSDLVIVYGDIIFRKNIFKKLINKKDPISVSIDRKFMKYWKMRMKKPLYDLETLKINKKNQITEIGKKPKSYNEIQGQYIGLIKISHKYFKQIRILMKKISNEIKDYKNLYMTDFLQYLINNKVKICPSYHNGDWQEFDKPIDFKINNFKG